VVCSALYSCENDKTSGASAATHSELPKVAPAEPQDTPEALPALPTTPETPKPSPIVTAAEQPSALEGSSIHPTIPATPDTAPAATPVEVETADREASVSGDHKSTSFRVEGVVAADVLNIRYEPNAEATMIGSIPAGTMHVEGLGSSTKVEASTWQRIRYGGVVGWVNGRFLKPNPEGSPQPSPPAKIEALTPLLCFGSEPNWAITFGGDGAVVCGSNCAPPPSGLRVTKILVDRNGIPDGFDLVDAQGEPWLSVVVAKTGKCSDGMSDDPYLYEFAGTGKPGNLTGCCRVKDNDEL